MEDQDSSTNQQPETTQDREIDTLNDNNNSDNISLDENNSSQEDPITNQETIVKDEQDNTSSNELKQASEIQNNADENPSKSGSDQIARPEAVYKQPNDSKGVSTFLQPGSEYNNLHSSKGNTKKGSSSIDTDFFDEQTSYLPTETLKTKKVFIEDQIRHSFKDERRLTDDISDLESEIFLASGRELLKLKRECREKEAQKASKEEKRKNLEEELGKIEKELEKRSNSESTVAEMQEISVASFYKKSNLADDLIANTILYVATYFDELSPKDFKEVTMALLKNQIGEVVIEVRNSFGSNPNSEEGKQEDEEKSKTEILPQTRREEVSLLSRWEKKANDVSSYFESCHLQAFLRDGRRVIDFTKPTLRRSLKDYFEDNQPFYTNRQLKKVETLLCHKSVSVAKKSIAILTESAILQDQGSEWLFGITKNAQTLSSFNEELYFSRISELIYRVQISLPPNRADDILIDFLNQLLGEIPDYAFDMVYRLLHRHFSYQVTYDIANSATRLLEWLKNKLDHIDHKSDVYINGTIYILCGLLYTKDSYKYIYDLLDVLYGWLPEEKLDLEQCSLSQKIASTIFIEYCKVTIQNIETESYGKWPSRYPLFRALYREPINSKAITINDTEYLSKLNLLARWILHQTKVNSKEHDISEKIEYEKNELHIRGFIIAEWLSI